MCVPFTQFPSVVSSCKASRVSPPGCLIQSRYRMFPSPHTPSCCELHSHTCCPAPAPFTSGNLQSVFHCYKLVVWRMLYKWNHRGYNIFSSVQMLSRVQLFVTPWITACQPSLSITNSRSTPKPMSIELVMASNHLIPCRPLLLLPSIFPSIRVFSNESALHIRWPKYWSFSFNISPSNEHPGLISFKMDWLDLLAVQGTLMSLLQKKAESLRIDAFELWC